MYEIEFHPSIENDLLSTARYYEENAMDLAHVCLMIMIKR